MISAFGVEHGISKSFSRLAPKLSRARMLDRPVKRHDTLENKLRKHSMAARGDSGRSGQLYRQSTAPGYQDPALLSPRRLAEAKTQKRAARGMYAAIGRLNKPNRTLP